MLTMCTCARLYACMWACGLSQITSLKTHMAELRDKLHAERAVRGEVEVSILIGVDVGRERALESVCTLLSSRLHVYDIKFALRHKPLICA